ncbi:hypothetical protein WwAna0364, partial [Wolbachia endosymbiont of Drosophila ananassae]
MPIQRTPEQSGAEAIPNVCVICENVMENTQPCVITNCKHIFHKSCMELRFHPDKENECPSCLAKVLRKDVKVVVGNCSPGAKPGDERERQLNRPNTRSVVRQLQLEDANREIGTSQSDQRLNWAQINPQSESERSLNTRLANNEIPRNSPQRGRSQRGRPQRQLPRNNDNWVRPNIEHLVRETVDRMLSSLVLRNGVENSMGQDQRDFDVPSPRAFSSGHTSNKVADIIQKWGVRFEGTAEGLSVDEFLYRVKVLTREHLNNDLEAMAKNVHQLLTGKASSWFWRFHKRTETFTWNQFCTGLREQYKENRSK